MDRVGCDGQAWGTPAFIPNDLIFFERSLKGVLGLEVMPVAMPTGHAHSCSL